MTRRSHVVRTDDQGGMATSRSIGGCEIFCASEDCGQMDQGDAVQIAFITIESTKDYQRCFVAATVGWITAHVPSPSLMGEGLTWPRA